MKVRTALPAFVAVLLTTWVLTQSASAQVKGKPMPFSAAVDDIAQHMISDFPLQAPRNNVAVMQFIPVSGAQRQLGEALMQKIRISMFDLDRERKLNFVSQGKVTDLIVSQGADSLKEIYDSKRRVELGKLLTADHFVYGTYDIARDGSAEIVSYLVEIESGLIRAQRVVAIDSVPEGLLQPPGTGSMASATGSAAARTYRVSSKPLRSDPEAARKYQMAHLFEERGRTDRRDTLYAEILASFPDSLEAMNVQTLNMTEDVVRLTAEPRYDETLLNVIRAIPNTYVSSPLYEDLHAKTLTWLVTLGNREFNANRTDEGAAYYEKAVAMGLPRSQYEAYLDRVKSSRRSARADDIRALMIKGDRDAAETKIIEWEVDSPNSPVVKQLKKEFDRPEGMVTIPFGVVQSRDVDAFNMDIYETTNKEFLDFVRANPAYRKGAVALTTADADYLKHWSEPLKFPAALANRPLTFVSQPVADAYCHWRKKRLPTSDEWGLAAGEGRRKYPWGDKEPTPELANFNSLLGGPLPGESHPQGRTPEGVYHMGGNVWELTSTTDGDKAVARGGCYFDQPEFLRTDYRGPRTRDAIPYTSRFTGLRCAQ